MLLNLRFAVCRLQFGLDILTSGLALLVVCCGSGCRNSEAESIANAKHELRMAVTTSTRDSGLVDHIIPVFERENNASVLVIASGTGKALASGREGNVDVVWVHSRKDEDEFVNDGHGMRREEVMHNYFEILGPASDPANVSGLNPIDALKKIAASKSIWISRGDNSGTHKREFELWSASGIQPNWESYLESGQGMGASLVIANEKKAYILCDRGTYLAMRKKVQLIPLAQKSDQLRNEYGILSVNPNKNRKIESELADKLIEFLISTSTQKMIEDFRVDGEPLFYPAHFDGSKP